MKILVIGSKGFIGSACYARLKAHTGFRVFGADVHAEYGDPHYIRIDATNSDFKQVFREGGFDICVNCAGAASVPDSFKHPEKDYLLNVHLLVSVLNAIRESRTCCRLIQMSSAAVYGDPVSLPLRESDHLRPLSPYGIHKKQAEELCWMYQREFGVSCCILRLFSAYGRGLKKQLFWDLHQKFLTGNPVTLSGTGEETREFIHVADIARAVEIIIRQADPDLTAVNIANQRPVTIASAAKTFLHHAGYKGGLRFDGVIRTGDPRYWHADNQLLKAAGYVPTIDFEIGIADYWKWLNEKK